MGSLETLVYELETKAKEERDLKKKAEYHQEAAKTWRKIGGKNREWERHWKWNLANYYYATGQDHLHSREFRKAKRCLLTGEKLFLDLELRQIALHCAEEYIHASYLEEKNKTPTLSFLDLQKSFLEKYKDFSSHRKYIKREHRYWNTKGKLFRREMRFGDGNRFDYWVLGSAKPGQSGSVFYNLYGELCGLACAVPRPSPGKKVPPITFMTGSRTIKEAAFDFIERTEKY